MPNFAGKQIAGSVKNLSKQTHGEILQPRERIVTLACIHLIQAILCSVINLNPLLHPKPLLVGVNLLGVVNLVHGVSQLALSERLKKIIKNKSKQ